ncbi:MAG TPA: toll/interleukin-1 receptor domain-containing protein [Candidatus Udaeobacter sp.]|jgi:hypothetical protein
MPHIFFSYSSKDHADVQNFAEAIYHEHNLSYWIDTDNILAGNSVVGKVNEGLECSEVVVLWVTSHSLNSNWVKAEWEPVLADQTTRGTSRIIPIVAAEGLEVPFVLRHIARLDLPSLGRSEVMQKLADRVTYGYEGVSDVFFRINRPLFGANCKAFWSDRHFCEDLKQLWTGRVGSGHELDYEYRFEGTTTAPAGSKISLDIQVEGSDNRSWPQIGGSVQRDGAWQAFCYLRFGVIQDTRLVFTTYPQTAGGLAGVPLVKRVFRIVR